MINLLKKSKNNKTGFIVLLDPDKIPMDKVVEKVKRFDEYGADLFFLGSSQPVKADISLFAKKIKEATSKPLIIFPGSPEQITGEADAILFITLISGRNPDYLIENHVIAAPYLKKLGIKVIPTAYILIDSGYKTSVEIVSKTTPLPNDNIQNIVAHALAGEMSGKRYIYLEAGSGAKKHISPETIKAVKEACTIPVIVGGGIRDAETAKQIVDAGADFIVVGNLFEKYNDEEVIKDFFASVK